MFPSIPVDLMFRYDFVPMRAKNGTLEIAMADPRNLNMIDELALLLNKKLPIKVATLSQIAELLKKTSAGESPMVPEARPYCPRRFISLPGVSL